MSVAKRQTATVTFETRHYSCPACGANDRWDYLVSFETPPPTIVIRCDCGQGELVVVVASESAPPPPLGRA